jgi:hypothetical protein
MVPFNPLFYKEVRFLQRKDAGCDEDLGFKGLGFLVLKSFRVPVSPQDDGLFRV